MKKVAGIIGALALCAMAQDGFYGSFMVGQKIVNMDPLNTTLKEKYADQGFSDFTKNYWTFGGEGHMIIARHFVLGGKGVGYWNTRKLTRGGEEQGEIKMTSALGLGTFGYALIAGDKERIRIIPQVGVGASTLMIQRKEYLSAEDEDAKKFSTVLEDDSMSVMQKVGLAVDAGLGVDYYLPIIEMVNIIPGLTFGPLIHGEIGYTMIPGNLKWMRDVDMLADFHPDIKPQGLYFNLGIGMGLSTPKQAKRTKE